MADKRRAAWRLKPDALKRIDECFRTQQSMLNTLGQNTKTGPKVMQGEMVKREQMKTFVSAFLNFLSSWKDGHISPDQSKFYPDDIAKALKAYLPDGQKVDWDTLCEEVGSGGTGST